MNLASGDHSVLSSRRAAPVPAPTPILPPLRALFAADIRRWWPQSKRRSRQDPAATLAALVAATLVAVLLRGAALAAAPRPLVINANVSDPVPRAAWTQVVQRFQRENPDVDVRLNLYDHESYKKAIRGWLAAEPPDVVFWFAGERMRQLVRPGLLADVSELFTPEVRAALHHSAVDLVSDGGKQFGVPYTTYQIGLYFRRDLLAAAGSAIPPRTFDELLALCDRLAAKGTYAVAIGTRDLWPTAAWFDYLDLRWNGYRSHLDLMEGRLPYTDARVREVFALWRRLLDRRCFNEHHASSGWQEAQALLYQGKAAMMLIGNYIVGAFPPEVKHRMDFVRFPVVREGVGLAEEAPVNTLHVPARARNPAEARRFLGFVLRADVQEEINRLTLQIPVRTDAAVVDDRFLAMGQALLRSADDLTQYFDRDTSEELANVAMKGFQEFMMHPERLDSILRTIEQARRRIYRP